MQIKRPSQDKKAAIKALQDNVALQRLNVDLPADLHRAFKKKTLDNDENITAAITRLVQDYVAA